MKIILNIIKSLRIKQWIKNTFVLMPLIFGGKLFNVTNFINALAAFVIFCITSSGIYLLNDIKDKKRDGFHPLKKLRPIASGELKSFIAFIISIVFLLAALLAAYLFNLSFFLVILLYIVLHIIYTFKLKREVLLDVFIIAIGFELRIWGGGIATSISPSIWLQLCVFLLALFLGLIKRRQEKTSLYRDAAKHRDVLLHYKVYFLDQIIMISAALCIVFYGLYTVSGELFLRTGSSDMAYTIPFVIYGIFRYLYIVHAKKGGGDPGEVLMQDLSLAVDIALWLAVSIFLIYRP